MGTLQKNPVACVRVCVCVYPFKLGFRVHHLIYLILNCCRQTTRTVGRHHENCRQTNIFIGQLDGWELLRALEPVHPGTVNQWTNENVLFVCVSNR